MSQENVEIVRRALDLLWEAYKSPAAADGLLELCTPDIRVDATHRVFNPDLYEGPAGVRRLVQDVRDAWENFSGRTERLVDLGDRVVVVETIGGRGRASGAHVEQKGALIVTLRGGLIELIEVFVDPHEALTAVGLEE